MLNKISNIETFSLGLNKSHNSGIVDSINGKILARVNLRQDDKIDISQAYRYLQKIEWRLKKVEYSAGKKIKCKFLLNDIEIETDIHIDGNGNAFDVNFNLIKTGFNGKLAADINVKLNPSVYIIKNLKDALKYINLLFERFSLLKIDKEISRSDSYALDGLLDGLYDGLLKEFNYINFHLLQFIEINYNIKLKPVYSKDSQLILLNKISLLND